MPRTALEEREKPACAPLYRESGAAPTYYGPETAQGTEFVPVGPSWWYASEPWVDPSDLSITHLYRVVPRRYIRLPPMLIHISPGAADCAGAAC